MWRKEDWSLFLYLIPCLIFFSAPMACAVNYTADCSVGNYSRSSGIGESLTLLFSSLSSLSSSSNFANTTATATTNADTTVYGLFMCQGDLPHSDCHSCINSAIIDINQSCSDSRSATIWYEFCELRYSDLNFFGIPVTEGHATYNPNWETSSTKPYQVLSTLVRVAPSSKPLMFASDVSNMYPLFAQAQCSSDLSVQNCSVCLTTILATINSCCVQRKGWRYFTPTCWVRYEPTPFFGDYPNATSPYIVRSQCASYGFLSGEVDSKQSNLRSLLSDLQSSAPATGFYNTSVGENSSRLFGLALCRGDLAADSRECSDCLGTAGAAIVDECPNKTEGFMWYGQCFVKYSDLNFFGTLDDSGYRYCSRGLVSQEIHQTTSAKARSLIPLAINNSLLFAADKVAINDTLSSYLLLQCTRDLTSQSCRLCLEIGISQVIDDCKQVKGWQYLSGSCTVRYETFPFYNETAAARILELQPEEGRGSPNVNAIAIALPIAGVAVLGALLCLAWCMWRRRGSKSPKPADLKSVQDRDLTFIDLDTIKVATNNFSKENKLGEGGFGPVYKGVLVDGKEIAVKRLSEKSKQGILEFKNEVKLIAQLQHKNLVRMLGCCVEEEEKLLIYEYLPNRSLDAFLFDPKNRESLSWERRFLIISGITKGLLYLHEDSLLKVIHRDLKASNVLLDKGMNPKISDFGMAKIYNLDETEVDNTHRIVGTFGYMAPEYAMNGIFSVKSDVFSYGVLLLEIISGERNGRAYVEQHGQNLLMNAWELWSANKALEFIDSLLANRYEADEVLKCIHIGLLCIQEKMEERPTMSEVVLMLRSDHMALPQPTQPPTFIKKSSELKNPHSSTMIPSSLQSINEVTESDAVPR